MTKKIGMVYLVVFAIYVALILTFNNSKTPPIMKTTKQPPEAAISTFLENSFQNTLRQYNGAEARFRMKEDKNVKGYNTQGSKPPINEPDGFRRVE